MKMVRVSPFIDDCEVSNVKNTIAYKIAEKLNTGQKLLDSEKIYLTREVNSNNYFRDSVALRGIRFDFSDFLKTFVVRQSGNWTEFKAYNKSTLRGFLSGSIEKIEEIKK